jgi:hypothetical protein
VVRATINPLDSGSFPYHSVPWQRRAGHWAGIGVGEQIRMPQKMINAATRAMLNNAGKSSGSQIVVDRGVMRRPTAVGSSRRTRFGTTGDGDRRDVGRCVRDHEIPNVTTS